MVMQDNMHIDIIENVSSILDRMPQDARAQLISQYDSSGTKKEPKVSGTVKKLHELYMRLKPEQQQEFMSLCEYHHGLSE